VIEYIETRSPVELVAIGTPDARILYHAGLILKASGAGAEGGELMSRALALNPRFQLNVGSL